MAVYNISGIVKFPNSSTKALNMELKPKNNLNFNCKVAIGVDGAYNINIEEGDYILYINSKVVSSHIYINQNGTLNSLIMNYLVER